LTIFNLIGIDVSKKLIINQPSFLGIESSQFNLYYNGALIDTLEECRKLESADVSKSVLKHSQTLFFNNNNYPSRLCPYLFRVNESLFLATFFEQPSISQNRPSFMDVKPKTAIDLNPSFKTMEFFYDELSLDESIMNSLVFGNSKTLGIFADKRLRIKSSVFEGFKKLERITIVIRNTSNFVRETKNEWLSSVNSDVKIDFKNKSSIDFYRSREVHINYAFYDYPEEDFCFFYRFPIQRLVFPLIANTDSGKFNCTCTVIWLLQFYPLSSKSSVLLTDSARQCSKNLFQSVQKCNFIQRIKACNDNRPNTAMALIDLIQARTQTPFATKIEKK
jgi:hypothetical protein